MGSACGKQQADVEMKRNQQKKGSGPKLKTGMIFTIEPMINAGKKDIKMLPDGWTVVTKDRSLSAQWEHTILVTDSSYEVLTVSEGTPKPFIKD